MTNNELHEYKTRIHNNLQLPMVHLKKKKGKQVVGLERGPLSLVSTN
jgi:hypothetical protein